MQSQWFRNGGIVTRHSQTITRGAVHFALSVYAPTGIPFRLPVSSLIDQALYREESAEAAGRFSLGAQHRLIRRAGEQLVFEWDGAL